MIDRQIINGRDRMIHPLVSFRVHVKLGTECGSIQFFFRPLVDNGSLHTVKRPAVQIRFNEILIKLRTHVFHQVTSSAKNRKVTHDRMPFLDHIIATDHHKRNDHYKCPEKPWRHPDTQYGKKKRYNNGKTNKIMTHDTALLFFFLRSEEHTSELQSLMRISYAVFCLK